VNLDFTVTSPQLDFHNLACKYPAFIGGFGSGKTEVLAQRAIADKLMCPKGPVACYEPTYDLVRLILAPRLEEKLDEYKIQYTYNKSENIIYTKKYGQFILRTLDNPSRIVGYESFRSHVDEIDTLRHKHAEAVWQKIIARNRFKAEGLTNQVSAYTTPEGFNFAYDRWEKNPGPDYKYIRVSTRANPFLPDDYIQGLMDSYPPNLVEAYIEGKFVNLTTGSVYDSFDRVEHHTPAEWDRTSGEPVHIGMDFNVGNMSSVIHVIRVGQALAVSEITKVLDTPAMIRTIKERYPGSSIVIYPDASGNSRKSNNASESDISLLKQANFKVDAPKANPFVRDRVISMNSAFVTGKYLVNVERCPEYALCLEQQTYTDNGDPDKSSGHDHLPDSGGYFIHRKYPVVNRKPQIAKVVGI